LTYDSEYREIPFSHLKVVHNVGVKHYRYGFQGQEKEDEVKGTGNSYDFGARMYDSRLGRWLSVGAFSGEYPSWSGYNFVGDNPIYNIEINGDYWIEFGAPKNRYGMRKRSYIITVNEPKQIEYLDGISWVPGFGQIAMGVKMLAASKDPSLSLSATDWISIGFSFSRSLIKSIGLLSQVDKLVLDISPNTMKLVGVVLNADYPELEIEKEAIFRMNNKGFGSISSKEYVNGLVLSEKMQGKLEQNAIEDLGLKSQKEVDKNRDLIDEKISQYLSKMMNQEKMQIKEELEKASSKIKKHLDEKKKKTEASK
jgi:RHS repeat-associated protein